MTTVVVDGFPVQGASGWGRFVDVFWRENLVVRGRARRVRYDEHAGPLSVKWTLAGEERYRLGRLEVAVDPGSYLIVNRGRRYASAIDAARPVESLAVFFRRGFVAGALAALIRPDDALLDQAGGLDGELDLIERRYPHDDVVSPRLHALRAAVLAGERGLGLDAHLHGLAEALLVAHRGALREAARVPAARASTRLELYRRLCRARDLIESCHAEPLDLDRLAAVACLSPHHLLRRFAATFGAPPARYLARRRIDAAAARLARDPETPIAEVARAVGFTSPAAFARAFRRERGLAPADFRASAIRNRGNVAAGAGR